MLRRVYGENLFTHEFSHVVQAATSDHKWTKGQNFPQDFPEEFRETFESEFKSDRVQDYFKSIPLNNNFGGESYPGVNTDFHFNPERLQKASPEIYDILTEYHGYDPLEGETVDRVGKRSFLEEIVERVQDRAMSAQ